MLISKALPIIAAFLVCIWLLSGPTLNTPFWGGPMGSEPENAAVCGGDVVSRESDDGTTWISFGQHLEPTMVHTAQSHSRPLRHLARVDNTSVAVAHIDACVLDSAEVFNAAHEFGSCGGYFRHDSLEDAVNSSNMPVIRRRLQQTKITQQKRIKVMLPLVKPERMAKMITHLSEDFPNRYYKSKAGVNAAKFIEKTWKDALKGLTSFASVRLYSHRDFSQPSVIATLKGKKSPEKIIIIGGHLDSIVGRGVPRGQSAETFRAPGADDNASGLTCTTEVLKVFAEHGKQPDFTLEFMGYAGEEKGLLGSDEIAKKYKREGKDVVGVLQLDMTGWPGASKSIYLHTRFVDVNLNAFFENLLKVYLPDYSVGKTDPKYASSDHASWHKQGYSAAIITESNRYDDNPNYHSTSDTLRGMGGNANTAARFARLGLLFAVEMTFDTIISPTTDSAPTTGSPPTPGSPSTTGPPPITIGDDGATTTTTSTTPSVGGEEETISIKTILLIVGIILVAAIVLFVVTCNRPKQPSQDRNSTTQMAQALPTNRSRQDSTAQKKRTPPAKQRDDAAKKEKARIHKKASRKTRGKIASKE